MLWNIPAPVFFVLFLGTVGCLVMSIVLAKSSWWKRMSDYYFSWNVKDEQGGK